MSRRLALAVMPLALLGLMLPGRSSGAMRPAAAARPSCVIPLPILCPSPSPTPSPSASGSPSPTAPGSPTSAPSGPAASASPQPTPSPGSSGTSKKAPAQKAAAGKKASSVKAATAPGLMVSAAQFSLTTGSALLVGMAYDGVAQVPTAGGGTVAMMKFTMSSLTLEGTPTLTVVQGGRPAVTTSTSMQFTGNVVLYATQLSGDLGMLPVTLTPSSPLSTILQLVNPVTPLVPLKLTNVTTAQPCISANSAQFPGLQVNTS
ncbi:MAG TPA: hypothetical protein VMV92_39635 [Streptosporangiaceae bacterium]|nr:hypothetical protein [Streptosporangiaceae bacterium]